MVAKNALVGSGTVSIGIRIFSTVSVFAVTVALARILGPEGLGIYSYCYTLFQIFIIIAQFGFPLLLVREIAALQALGKENTILRVVKMGFALPTLACVMIIGFGVMITSLFSEEFTHTQLQTFFFSLVLLFVVLMTRICSAVLRGLHLIVQSQLLNQALRPAVFITFLLLTIIFVGDTRFGPGDVMEIHVGAAMLALVIASIALWRALPEGRSGEKAGYDLQKTIRDAVPFTIIAGLQVVNGKIDMVMLGFFVNASEIGIYRVAFQASLLTVLGLQAINYVAAPIISRLHTLNEKNEIQRLLTFSARLVAGIALPVAALLMVYGEEIMRVAFGRAYAEGGDVLFVLTLGQLVSALTGSVGMILNMTGNERSVAGVLLGTALLNVVLNLLMIPVWGINGAAIATVLSLSLLNVSLWYLARKKLGLDTTAFEMPVYS